MSMFHCTFCKRNNFKSERGVKQHQNQSKACYRKMLAAVAGRDSDQFGPTHLGNFDYIVSNDLQRSQAKRAVAEVLVENDSQQQQGEKIPRLASTHEPFAEIDQNIGQFAHNPGQEDESSGTWPINEQDDVEEEEGVPQGDGTHPFGRPNRDIIDNFHAYVAHAKATFLPFTEEEANGVKLMALLNKKRPLWTHTMRQWSGISEPVERSSRMKSWWTPRSLLAAKCSLQSSKSGTIIPDLGWSLLTISSLCPMQRPK